MTLKNYSATSNNFWSGRIDDTKDRDSFRMHQIVKLLDLNTINFSIDQTKKNISFLSFLSDEGVIRNLGRSGANLGPEYIRKEFANLPVTFDENTIIYDSGDIICSDNNLEDAQNQLKSAVNILLSNNIFPIVLGGGHELAFGHYMGIDAYLNKPNRQSIGIINFDAHLDLRPYSDKGSSGTMFSQIADYCNNEKLDFNYMCLGTQTSGNTISLFKRADSLGVRYIHAKDFVESNYSQINSVINDFINKNDYIYLTVCSDVFNSAFAPGVSALQPFGMNPEIVLKFLKEIIHSKKVISMDIAEVSPRFDQDNNTAKLAAVIIYAIINSLTEHKG